MIQAPSLSSCIMQPLCVTRHSQGSIPNTFLKAAFIWHCFKSWTATGSSDKYHECNTKKITLHSGFPACRDFVHYWNVSARRLGYTPLQAPLHYTILHYKRHRNATATPPLHPAIHSSNRLHFTAGHIPGSNTGADAQSRLRPKLSKIGVLQFWEFYLI